MSVPYQVMLHAMARRDSYHTSPIAMISELSIRTVATTCSGDDLRASVMHVYCC